MQQKDSEYKDYPMTQGSRGLNFLFRVGFIRITNLTAIATIALIL